MTEDNVAYLRLGDEKHEIDKLSNQQKFMCSQMKNLQQRSIALTSDLDVVNRALQSVQNDLIASLQTEDAQVLAS
tara:strand:+ start:66 stop:290 length:225 start_codon:yes stop_codon:yes gene_type:complete